MADIAGLLLALYVFHAGSPETPLYAGKVSGLSHDYSVFRNVVVDGVVASGYLTKYDRDQLGSGKLFVVDETDDVPGPPTGRPLKPTAAVNVSNGQCIVLDIRSLPAAAAAPAAGSDLAATVSAAVRAALEERSLFDRMNPFARSHHSDSISLHTVTGAARFPGSEPERVAFKQQVAEFYGLTSLLPILMVDMFNKSHLKKNVTLAHIWPASYTNWDDPRDELALPVDFHKEPRNFLLLPRNVHEAFDHGRLIFVPSPTDITCFVLPGASVSKAIRKLHGKKLHLPKHATGGVPYKRQLAYFALRAKGRAAVDATIQAALEAAMAASADEAGNAALQEVEQRMRAINII